MLWFVQVIFPFSSAPQWTLLPTQKIDWVRLAEGKPLVWVADKKAAARSRVPRGRR